MRVKANFDAEEAITYMRHGGKLYLDGWVYWYNERMILQDMSPILVVMDTEATASVPISAINLWSNLNMAEMDEPCFITRENLDAIAKRYDVSPREAGQDIPPRRDHQESQIDAVSALEELKKKSYEDARIDYLLQVTQEEVRAEIKDLKKSAAYLQDELFRLQNAIF